MTPLVAPGAPKVTKLKSNDHAADLPASLALPARPTGTTDGEAPKATRISPRKIFTDLAEITPLICGYRSALAFEALRDEAFSQGALVVAEIDSEKLTEFGPENQSGYLVVCELQLNPDIRETYLPQALADPISKRTT